MTKTSESKSLGGALTKSLAPQTPVPPKIGAETMEKVLILGDLKTLTPRERVAYYNGVCQWLGLNPLTQPFSYLHLNGKLLLYAKRECTDQLRKLHGVNLAIKAREVTEGCYVVTAAATLPDGRHDESIGAVPIEGLKGESRANSMMKAETKSKRRATLSICGLGFLDESEVDSVHEASPAAIDPETGEALSSDPDRLRNAPPVEQAEPARPWKTFREMLQRFAALKERLSLDEEIYYEVLARFEVRHANEFRDKEKAAAAYNELLNRVRQYEASAEESAIDAATMIEEPPDQEASA
jgi:hypothetical protein